MANLLFAPDRPALCARCEERALEETFRAWREAPGEAARAERNAVQRAAKKAPAPARQTRAGKPLWRRVSRSVLLR